MRQRAGITLRRIDWVRVVVAGEAVRCEADVVSHRLPAVRAIGLREARLLAQQGVPVVVCHDR
jgi:acyl dehydratase